ncbi:HEAT repeat domain-containing protein [Zooshikella marina]|uniref:HEAT repeat domain-containing protein n=1 Tax=Zooshikella ganghwensis TaxID=202772 RepID=UPI001BB0C5EE|nr:HEAT repeat domain-containing protein [Zooshikella ganghwensis]MBU2708514.1 HEAT repeat domain-containing protein [Zooshikella ganghwensis]
MSQTLYLPYRGAIRALLGHDNQLYWVTEHSEGQPTGLYYYNVKTKQFKRDALATGAKHIAIDEGILWLMDSQHQLWKKSLADDVLTPVPFSPAESIEIDTIVIADKQLAVLQQQYIWLLGTKNGELQQQLTLMEPGVKLAVDKTGKYIAVGSIQGLLTIYAFTEEKGWQLYLQQEVHKQAFTALAFSETDGRLYSCGQDKTFYCIDIHTGHDDIALLDRGQNAMHKQAIKELFITENRLFTAASDKTLKSWPMTKGQPVTYTGKIPVPVDLAYVQDSEQGWLAVAGEDHTIQLIALTAEHRFGQSQKVINDAIAEAKFNLSASDIKHRQQGIEQLAQHFDQQSLRLLADVVERERDVELRRLAAKYLTEARHPSCLNLWLKQLKHSDDDVRLKAFTALQSITQRGDIRLAQKALQTEYENIGFAALALLTEWVNANEEGQSQSVLMEALNHNNNRIRHYALHCLEQVTSETIEIYLHALNTQFSDIRRAALIRCYQQQQLMNSAVNIAVRQRLSDQDNDVRNTAFWVMVLSRKALAAFLYQADEYIARQLTDINDFSLHGQNNHKSLEKQFANVPLLTQHDIDILLPATVSHYTDIVLLAARCLAHQQHPCALPVLLQLVNHQAQSTRLDVCYALSLLKDQHALSHLQRLLNDKDGGVRMAAFSAIEQLLMDEPYQVIALAWQSTAEDVHLQGLQRLLAMLEDVEPSYRKHWLLQGINSPHQRVRQEAAKACLNTAWSEGKAEGVALLLDSHFEDCHLIALHELLAHKRSVWQPALLIQLFNDGFYEVRSQAFAAAQKQFEDQPIKPLQHAAESLHRDLRQQALKQLIDLNSDAAQLLLVSFIADEDPELRHQAIDSLIIAQAWDEVAVALSSTHKDCVIAAAKALAMVGDERAQQALCQLLAEKAPESKEHKIIWQNRQIEVLEALAELGSADAVPYIQPYLQDKHQPLATTATYALSWCATPAEQGLLQRLLQVDNTLQQAYAALGLVLLGQHEVAGILEQKNSALTSWQQLAVFLCLNKTVAGHSEPLTVRNTLPDVIQNQPLLGFLLGVLPHTCPQAVDPTPLLDLLNQRDLQLHLYVAQALAVFNDKPALQKTIEQSVVCWLQQESSELSGSSTKKMGDDQATLSTDVTTETLLTLDDFNIMAAILLADNLPLKARFAYQLFSWVSEEPKRARLIWLRFKQRYQEDIQQLLLNADTQSQQNIPPTSEQCLQQWALGILYGLLSHQQLLSSQGVALRLSTLQTIIKLTDQFGVWWQQAEPMLIQCLHDKYSDVRQRAWALLSSRTQQKSLLIGEALQSQYLDIAKAGLQLIAAERVSDAEVAVLKQCLQERTDGLEFEAFTLYAQFKGEVQAAVLGTKASSAQLRSNAVQWLLKSYEEGKSELFAILVEAMQGAWRDTALQVAIALYQQQGLLSSQQDAHLQAGNMLVPQGQSQAMVVLLNLLANSQQQREARLIVNALRQVNQPEIVGPVMQMIESNRSKSLPVEDLLTIVAKYRQVTLAPQLLKLLNKHQHTRAVTDALTTISGYDQALKITPTQQLQATKYPLCDELLVQLVQTLVNLGHFERLEKLLKPLKFAESADINSLLANIMPCLPDAMFYRLLEHYTWRVRYRGASAQLLQQLLAHRQAQVRFIAAEGLAMVGDRAGKRILLAAIDMDPAYENRQRAVIALGRLGDADTVDLLLDLATNEEHALQDDAIEAVGYLKHTDQADKVLSLLTKIVKQGESNYASQIDRAIKALRWFDSPKSWAALVACIQNKAFLPRYRVEALRQMRFAQDSQHLRVLFNLVELDDNRRIVSVAMEVAEHIWPVTDNQVREIDYVVLKNQANYWDEKLLIRVARYGDGLKRLLLLAECSAKTKQLLSQGFLANPIYDESLLLQGITHEHPDVNGMAARLIGRLSDPSSTALAAVEAMCQRQLTYFRRSVLPLHVVEADQKNFDQKQLKNCLRDGVWCLIKHQAADIVLTTVYQLPAKYLAVQSLMARVIQLQLQQSYTMSEPLIELLESLKNHVQGSLQQQVFTLLSKVQNEPIADSTANAFDALAENWLGQPSLESLQRLEEDTQQPLLALAGKQQHSIESLLALINNEQLITQQRADALLALGYLQAEDAEFALEKLIKAKSLSPSLQKTAYRALRSSQRARQRKKTELSVADVLGNDGSDKSLEIGDQYE